MVESILPRKPASYSDTVDTEGGMECITCHDIIQGQVWLCPECSSIQCVFCLEDAQNSARSDHGCPRCRVTIQDDFVRCRPIEELIAKKKKSETDICKKHKTKKFYLCLPCRVDFCPICLLEDGAHEGHPRKNIKEMAPFVKQRLKTINEQLVLKRR